MHLLVRETRELDEAEDAVDLGQSRADLVFLSFPTATSAHSPLPGPRKGKWLRRPPANSRGCAIRCLSIFMSSRWSPARAAS